MFAQKPHLNPETSSTERCSPVNSVEQQQQRQQQPNFFEWTSEFNKTCRSICGTKCPETLEETMKQYIGEIKKEMVSSNLGPNRASFIANRMIKTLMFFYLYYLEIREFCELSQWIENISPLLLYYCEFELKASHRVLRGTDSDRLVSTRIMSALWIFLFNNYEAMIHIVLQIPNIGRRHRNILDPVFRKLLVYKNQKPLTELEYLRNLLAFKLWKRLHGKDDKKAISHLAITELTPPISFLRNYRKYKFLPPCGEHVDVHAQLVTELFDLDSAIREYLEMCKTCKRVDYHFKRRKSCISEMCSNFDGIYGDEEIEDDAEIEDDDCIIIDEDPEPAPVQRTIPPSPTEFIDLTADEPEQTCLTNVDDEIPQWCKDLIKLSTSIKKNLKPISITKETLIPGSKSASPTPSSSGVNEIGNPRKEISPPPTEKTKGNNSRGLTEISFTNHTVQDVPQKSTFIEFPEQPGREHAENFEHADTPTNNNQEPEGDEPTIKTFVVEQIVTLIPQCETSEEDVSGRRVLAVSNIDFEQFAAQNVKRAIENGLTLDQESKSSPGCKMNKEYISGRKTLAVSDTEFEQFAAQHAKNAVENGLILNQESETSFDDFTSPAMEPLSGDDVADYLAEMEKELYGLCNKDLDPHRQKSCTKRRTPKFATRTSTPLSMPETGVQQKQKVRVKKRPIPATIVTPAPKELKIPKIGKEAKKMNRGRMNPVVLLKREVVSNYLQDMEHYKMFKDSLEAQNEKTRRKEMDKQPKRTYTKRPVQTDDTILETKTKRKKPMPAAIIAPTPKKQKILEIAKEKKTKRGPKKQETTKVVKKRKVGRKSTRPSKENLPPRELESFPQWVTSIEKNFENTPHKWTPKKQTHESTPWRFLFS